MTITPPREKNLAEKIFRFGIVGLGNTLVDFTVFWLCLRAGLPPLAGNVVAWTVAVLVSYAVNATWSFDRTRRHRDALPRFLAAGALISLLVSSLFVGLVSALTGLWPAKIAGTLVAAVLNFIAARWSIESRLGR